MSSLFPKFQPIIFEPYQPDECNCDAEYKLLAEYNDYSQFQVLIGPCAGAENVIEDATFRPDNPPVSAWGIEGAFVITNQACKDAEAGSGQISQYNAFVLGTAYYMEVVVNSIFGELIVLNGATEIDVIKTTGTTVISFIATSPDLHFSMPESDHSVCLASASAWAFSTNMAFGIIDSDGNTVVVKTIADDPDYFTFSKNSVTIKFQWSDLGISDPGCYTIGFSETCENTNGQFGVFNSNFDYAESGWTETIGTLTAIDFEEQEHPDTGFIEPMVEFSGSTTTSGSITNEVTELLPGLCYTITVSGFSTDANGILRIYAGTNFVDFSGNGSQNVTCAGNGTFKIEAFMLSSTNIKLWDVTVELCNLSDFEFDFESHSFRVDEEIGCTHIVNLSNDDDAFGMVFEDSFFAPSMRIPSEIINSAYDEDRKVYHDNLGKKQVYYGETRKKFFFNIDPIPTWLIDFMALCRIADHFFIDGTEYHIEGDGLEPNYPYPDCPTNMGSLQIEVSEKIQLYRNADIGNAENPIAANSVTFVGFPDANGEAEADSQIIEASTQDILIL